MDDMPTGDLPRPVDPVAVRFRTPAELGGLRTPPPIRVDVEQLSRALEPVVQALADIHRTIASFAPAVEQLGRQMQQAQQEQARRARNRPYGS